VSTPSGSAVIWTERHAMNPSGLISEAPPAATPNASRKDAASTGSTSTPMRRPVTSRPSLVAAVAAAALQRSPDAPRPPRRGLARAVRRLGKVAIVVGVIGGLGALIYFSNHHAEPPSAAPAPH